MKRCSKCHETLPAERFYLCGGKLSSYCRPCHNKARKARYAANREAEHKTQRDWRRRNPGKSLAVQRKYQYGITSDEVNALRQRQEGLCAICRGGLVPECVDHDHSSGRVRGLLCKKCNSLLGFARDSVEILTSAIKYLQKP